MASSIEPSDEAERLVLLLALELVDLGPAERRRLVKERVGEALRITGVSKDPEMLDRCAASVFDRIMTTVRRIEVSGGTTIGTA